MNDSLRFRAEIEQVKPWLAVEEQLAVSEVVAGGWITEGPRTAQFEAQLNELIGSAYGVFAPNGTLALALALMALGVGPGDEVIVPDTTFIGSATSVLMVGALPVFVDVDPDTFQIDVAKAEAAVTAATRAIMPVHLYGSACDMVGIMALAGKHGLKVIEDAAQGIGVRTSLGHVGAIGDIGTFSFFADKTITTGEGGYIATNDPALYEKLRYLRNQGRLDRGSFVHPEIGYNFRITDMQAAMGLVQLGKLDEIVRRKTRNLALYEEGLAGLEQGRLIGRHADTNNVPFRCVLLADRVQELSGHLAEHRIQPRSFFYPLRKQPAFAGVCPPPDEAEWNSDVGFARGVCLPIHPQLSEDDIAYICETIRSFYA